MHTDKCAPRYNFEKSFNIHIPQRNEWERDDFVDPSKTSIFTDGSKIESGTGSFVYSRRPYLKISRSLGQYLTISQAEIYVIIDACDEISRLELRNHVIDIYTDNHTALRLK